MGGQESLENEEDMIAFMFCHNCRCL